MSYLLDRKIKRNKFLKWTIAVLVLFFLFYFRMGILRGFSSAAHFVFRPILISGDNVGNKFSDMGAYFTSKRELLAENENLKSQIEASQTDRANYASVVDENNQMKEILGRLPAQTGKDPKANLVIAGILSKPNQSPYDTLIIDAGAVDDVAIGARVFAEGNVPIGYIGEVYADSAEVILYSNPGEKTDVIVPLSPISTSGTIQNSETSTSTNDTAENALPSNPTPAPIGPTKNVSMQLVGRGGENFEMILPRDLAIAEGVTVTLPGVNPYVIAVVKSILTDPRDSYQKALLASPVNIFELNLVEVEK